MKELKSQGFEYLRVESVVTFKLDTDSVIIDPETKKLLDYKIKTVPLQTEKEIKQRILGEEDDEKGKIVAVELLQSSVDANQFLVFVKYKK